MTSAVRWRVAAILLAALLGLPQRALVVAQSEPTAQLETIEVTALDVSPSAEGSAFEVRLSASNRGGTAGERTFMIMDQTASGGAYPVFQANFTLPAGGHFEIPFTWTPVGGGAHHLFVAEQPDLTADVVVAGEPPIAAPPATSGGPVRVDTTACFQVSGPRFTSPTTCPNQTPPDLTRPEGQPPAAEAPTQPRPPGQCTEIGQPELDLTAAATRVAGDVQAQPCQSAPQPFAIITPNILDGATGLVFEDGALDFGILPSLQHETPSPDVEYLNIANAGTADLKISDISIPVESSFERVEDQCSAGSSIDAIKPGGRCQVGVQFVPHAAHEDSIVYMEITDNTPYSPRRIRLHGTGSGRPNLPALSVEERVGNESGLPGFLTPLPGASDSCLKRLGWEPVSKQPRVLEGDAVQAHITTADATVNHHNIDYNVFVYPDPTSKQLLVSPGSFHEGDPLEWGRVEVEWEIANGPQPRPESGGLPAWAWPALGDRVHVVGTHILDCGHGHDVDFDQFPNIHPGNGLRTEIHPPQLVVTYRNATLAAFGGTSGRLGWHHPWPSSSGPREGWATRADVFASTYGGLAIQSEFGVLPNFVTKPIDYFTGGKFTKWWQPLTTYKFIVKAPPKPAPDAELALDVTPGTLGGPNESGSLTWEKLTDGRVGDFGYEFTLSFPNGATEDSLTTFGRRLFVGWKTTSEARPVHLRSYSVSVRALNILEPLTKVWGLYGYVNFDGQAMRLGLPKQSPLNENMTELPDAGGPGGIVFCGPSSGVVGCAAPLQAGVFQGELVDQQPLHIQFRGIAFDPRVANNTLAGIVDYTLVAGATPDARPIWRSTDAEPGGIEDLQEPCGGRQGGTPSCFTLLLDIHQAPTGP